MTDDMEADNTGARDEIRQFVQRIERIEAEIQDANEAKKETYAEAKSRGYDTAILRKVVARRKMDRDAVAEADALLEMYEGAMQ